MKYINQSFSAPVCTKAISQLEYDLRVGNITQAEFDAQAKPHNEHVDSQTGKRGPCNCS